MTPAESRVSQLALLPFYTVAEVAALLKVSLKTVRRRIDQGDLPVHRIGRQIRISQPDLAAFVRARRETRRFPLAGPNIDQ